MSIKQRIIIMVALPLTALLLVWGYARILRFPRWRWAALVVVIAGIQFVASRHEMIDASRGR